MQPLTKEHFEAIVGPEVEPPLLQGNGLTDVRKPFDVEGFFKTHKIAYKPGVEEAEGVRYILEKCPLCGHAGTGKASVFLSKQGVFGFHCFHNDCDGKGWHDFRQHFEPDAYARKEESAHTKLLKITKLAKYLRTPGGELFAQVPVKGHFEVVSICEHGSGFRRWLVYMYKSQYGIAPNSDALSQVMTGVFAEAEYDGQVTRVYTRIAEHKGCIYLDLANDKWQCVEIS